jgi:FKBP-type peptidyl-prolyl cis-trans isomerase 2
MAGSAEAAAVAGESTKATEGKRIAVHYTGTLDNGEVFDSSDDRDPLEFTMGGGNVIAGFENAIRGMSPGEEKTVTLGPEEAYGVHDPTLLVEGPRSAFPIGDIREGGSYTVHMKAGGEAEARVVKVTGDRVTLDFNHPLAGKRLTFHVKVVSVT